jgi:hypothetical protein
MANIRTLNKFFSHYYSECPRNCAHYRGVAEPARQGRIGFNEEGKYDGFCSGHRENKRVVDFGFENHRDEVNALTESYMINLLKKNLALSTTITPHRKRLTRTSMTTLYQERAAERADGLVKYRALQKLSRDE